MRCEIVGEIIVGGIDGLFCEPPEEGRGVEFNRQVANLADCTTIIEYIFVFEYMGECMCVCVCVSVCVSVSGCVYMNIRSACVCI